MTDTASTDGLDPDARDASDPAGVAASQQTVANDAVAGETVADGDGTIPVAVEAAPTSDEYAAANDGYLAPRNETGEDIDLNETGESGEVTTTYVDPDADGPADAADGSETDPGLDAPAIERPDDHIVDLGSGLHP